MIREIFKDAESVRSGPPHVPSHPALLPPFRDPDRMLSRKDEPPDIWDTHGISGNVFCRFTSVLSPYPGKFNPWTSDVTEQQTQLWIRDPSQDRQPEIHSTRGREDFQRIMGQTNKDCRFRNFILTNSLHKQHLLVGR